MSKNLTPEIEPLSPSNIYKSVQEMNEYGNRWLGTPGEIKVRDYILNNFKKNGLTDVHLEEVSYNNYMPKSSHLRLISPTEEIIKCEPLQYSANKTVEGEIIYVGEGSKPEFENLENNGISLKGKIVMATSFFPYDYIAYAENKGAAGFIVVSDAPHDLIRGLVAKLGPPELANPQKHVTKTPGVVIALRSAQKLWSMMSMNKIKVEIAHEGIYTVKKSSNVIGVVPGTKFPEEILVIGGHYDSQFDGHFAWDNLTGISSIIEISRIFAKNKPLRTVMFVAFTGEEIGFWGSTSFVQKNKENFKKNCLAMLCLDSLGNVHPTKRGIWAKGKPYLDFILKKAKQVDWPLDIIFPESWVPWSDHAPFADIGIPAVYIVEFPPINPYYHTNQDIIDYIDPIKIVQQANVSVAVAYDIVYKLQKPVIK